MYVPPVMDVWQIHDWIHDWYCDFMTGGSILINLRRGGRYSQAVVDVHAPISPHSLVSLGAENQVDSKPLMQM